MGMYKHVIVNVVTYKTVEALDQLAKLYPLYLVKTQMLCNGYTNWTLIDSGAKIGTERYNEMCELREKFVGTLSGLEGVDNWAEIQLWDESKMEGPKILRCSNPSKRIEMECVRTDEVYYKEKGEEKVYYASQFVKVNVGALGLIEDTKLFSIKDKVEVEIRRI